MIALNVEVTDALVVTVRTQYGLAVTDEDSKGYQRRLRAGMPPVPLSWRSLSSPMSDAQWILLRALADIHGARFSRAYSRSEAAEIIDDLIQRPLPGGSQQGWQMLEELKTILREREAQAAHPPAEAQIPDRIEDLEFEEWSADVLRQYAEVIEQYSRDDLEDN